MKIIFLGLVALLGITISHQSPITSETISSPTPTISNAVPPSAPNSQTFSSQLNTTILTKTAPNQPPATLDLHDPVNSKVILDVLLQLPAETRKFLSGFLNAIMQHLRNDPDFYGALAIIRDHLRQDAISADDIVNHLIQNGHLRNFDGVHNLSGIQESAKQAAEYTDEEFNLHDPVNVQRILDVLVSLPRETTEFLKLFLNSVIPKLPKDTDFYGGMTVILKHLNGESPSSEAIMNELLEKQHIRPKEGYNYQVPEVAPSTMLDEGKVELSQITEETSQEDEDTLEDPNEILVPRAN